MRSTLRAILVLSFCLLPSAFAQIAVQWSPADFTGYVLPSQQIGITGLWNYTVNNQSNIVTGVERRFSTGTRITSTGATVTGTPGTLIVSNVLYGGYRVIIYNPGITLPVSTFTNLFTNGMPAFTNAAYCFAVSTNSVDGNSYAYTRTQADGKFIVRAGDTATHLTNGSPDLATNAASATDGQVLVKRGTNLNLETISGGASLSQSTQVVNAVTGVVSTNGADLTTKFTTTGTNTIISIAQQIALTNGSPGSLLTLTVTSASGCVTNNGIVWYSTNGVPLLALPNGSFATGNGQVYIRTNAAWVVVVGGSASATKVYRAILNQSGAGAPAATVLENTLGGSVVWTRFDVGYYQATLAGAFTINKTFQETEFNTADVLGASATPEAISAARASADIIEIKFGVGGDSQDFSFDGGYATVTILVYP